MLNAAASHLTDFEDLVRSQRLRVHIQVLIPWQLTALATVIVTITIPGDYNYFYHYGGAESWAVSSLSACVGKEMATLTLESQCSSVWLAKSSEIAAIEVLGWILPQPSKSAFKDPAQGYV